MPARRCRGRGGGEWEVGQSGDKDVLVLRSLQGKISSDERSLLLRENVTFPAPTDACADEYARTVPLTFNPVELDDNERTLMSTTIGAFAKSPHHRFELLAPIVGQPSCEDWVSYIARLHRAITDGEDLLDLDWARALFLTEIGFSSALVGFGRKFKGADAHALNALRSLQLTIGNRVRRELFRENATYPWIELPSSY